MCWRRILPSYLASCRTMYVDSLSVELIASSRARDDVSSWTQKAKNLSRLEINT